MKTTPEPDLTDRLSLCVDPDVEPADWTEALAEFLVAYYREQSDE